MSLSVHTSPSLVLWLVVSHWKILFRHIREMSRCFFSLITYSVCLDFGFITPWSSWMNWFILQHIFLNVYDLLYFTVFFFLYRNKDSQKSNKEICRVIISLVNSCVCIDPRAHYLCNIYCFSFWCWHSELKFT